MPMCWKQSNKKVFKSFKPNRKGLFIMKTKAVRLYGKKDLRLEEFELPEIKDDEILARVVSDSICMSSYKAAIQGPDHKRVPDDVATNPVIIGHEFCGVIEKVGKKWQDRYTVGSKFVIQPAHNYKGSQKAPGYSYQYAGGSATYIIIPFESIEMDCLLSYDGDAFFYGSLGEPMSCIVGAFHAQYHIKPGTYVHDMEIKPGGKVAILAGAGPMGLGAVDYAIHGPVKPSLVVVTDIDDARLTRASKMVTPESAAKEGIKLIYLNPGKENPVSTLLEYTNGEGYDDVFVFAPVAPVVEQGDAILGRDGCLNFFAGPTDPSFSAKFNFYNVHYGSTHIAGTSGGNNEDLRESIDMMSKGILNPSTMVTHVGGLDSVAETTLNLPNIPGGKKLIYTNIKLPLTALDDLGTVGTPLFDELDRIVKAHNGLWSYEAEQYLLANAEAI